MIERHEVKGNTRARVAVVALCVTSLVAACGDSDEVREVTESVAGTEQFELMREFVDLTAFAAATDEDLIADGLAACAIVREAQTRADLDFGEIAIERRDALGVVATEEELARYFAIALGMVRVTCPDQEAKVDGLLSESSDGS